jgi:hypothetical protein
MWILNQVSQKITSPHKSAGGIPDDFMLVNDTKLPGPFFSPDGTRSRVQMTGNVVDSKLGNLSCDTN